jgi:hypothetical protein
LWLIKVWFSASTFVVKIATFAKHETAMGKAIIVLPAQIIPYKLNLSYLNTFAKTTLFVGIAYFFNEQLPKRI